MTRRIESRSFRYSRQRMARCILGLLVGVLLLSGPGIKTQTALALIGESHRHTGQVARIAETATNLQEKADTLEPGKPIERELTGGQVHSYQISLSAGQYLRVMVEQRGIDVVAALFGPGDQQVGEFDRRWLGAEPVSLIADVSGTYRLEIRSVQKTATQGRYQIRIQELRESAPQDKNYLAAERASTEGKRLLTQGIAASLRQAREKYEVALPLWRAVGDRFGEAQTLNSIGYTYLALGDLPKALDYLNQALSIRQAIKDLGGEGETLHNIASVYSFKGEKTKAINYYDQSLPLRRATGDRSGEAMALNNIGVIYYSLGENRKAMENFNQALPLWRAVGDRTGEVNTLTSLGAIYSLFGEPQKAIDHHNQALSLSRSINDRRGEAAALINIGAAYDLLNESQKGLDYYSQSLPLFRLLGD
ncbi:MAG: tetratricopeptide repeat protein, partial [Acidobacteria bacterium]|nr:tetratricopeptide repeat protein [Acidobacteriota bacterium]